MKKLSFASSLALSLVLAACGDGSTDTDAGLDGSVGPTADTGTSGGDGAADDAGESQRDGGHVDASPGDGSVEDGATGDAELGDGSLADGATDGGSTACLSAGPTGAMLATDTLTDTLGNVSVAIDDRESCRRTYTISSTAARRDNVPESPRSVAERADGPSLRTGHDLFDALYALAVEEAHENMVATIRDYAFDDGNPVDCGGCFETGRNWHYVWTRDTAFSAALGIASIDPERAARSLAFKLSERRGGGGLEVVQDTGSGGSWPVSTDRVSWAFGARATLAWLDGTPRTTFRDRALTALRNTLERDRRTVFDAGRGLYRGEQSFLDWREQTYPDWTANALSHIAMSESLSTNLLHLIAIEESASLADETGDTASRDRWRGWAAALRTSIHDTFWNPEAGLFSAFTTTGFDRSPVRRWDLLAESLAILTGVASPAEATSILSRYPHVGAGAAPVIFPQQQLTPIYHNRAEWPFVTAFWLRAAQRGQHAAAADRAMGSLVRAAGLNLSNMENLEAIQGAPFVEDGSYSGPVVNSQRQLWSVAGYLSMVQETLFGITPTRDGLEFHPFVTQRARREWFGNASNLVLRNVPYRGRFLDIVIPLPDLPVGTATEAYEHTQTLVNSEVVTGPITTSSLGPVGSRALITLVLRAPLSPPATTITSITDTTTDWHVYYGPRSPLIPSIGAEGGRVRIGIDVRGEVANDVALSIYRDGIRVASALPGTTATYLDELTDADTTSHCFTVESCFTSSGTCSQHSPPNCWWGPSAARVRTYTASSFAVVGGVRVNEYDRDHYQAWGDVGHRLEVSGFVAPSTGRYWLQTEYGNGGPISTGITCAVKSAIVEDMDSGEVVGSGMLVMPHLGTWSRWGESSLVDVALVAGHRYRILIQSDDDTVNMSVFQHFASYTAGQGGRSGSFLRVNISQVRVLYRGT